MSDFRCNAIHCSPPATCSWPNCACSCVNELMATRAECDRLREQMADEFARGFTTAEEKIGAELARLRAYVSDAQTVNAELLEAVASLRADNERLGNVINTASEDYDRLRCVNEGLVAALKTVRVDLAPIHICDAVVTDCAICEAVIHIDTALRSATEKGEP